MKILNNIKVRDLIKINLDSKCGKHWCVCENYHPEDRYYAISNIFSTRTNPQHMIRIEINPHLYYNLNPIHIKNILK
jgi:hypothetical protein